MRPTLTSVGMMSCNTGNGSQALLMAQSDDFSRLHRFILKTDARSNLIDSYGVW